MTQATRIKIVIDSVLVFDDNDWLGAGEWIFQAEVHQLPSGTVTRFGEDRSFEAREGQSIRIGWEQELALDPGDRRVEIRLNARDEDLVWDDPLGSVKITLNCPVVHDYDLSLRSSEQDYLARIRVEILERVEGATGSVTTVRGHVDSDAYSTIHDGMMQRVVHISPVVPVPWATGIPPVPRGVQGLSASPQRYFGASAGDDKPNSLINPAVIPAILPGAPEFDDRVARIRVTQHRPADLDSSRLIWKAATPNIRFWHHGASTTEVRGGLEVKAYSLVTGDDEECLIEVRWDEPHQPLLTRFRAWAGRIRYVWTRANIITCSRTHVGGVQVLVNPSITPADIQAHIAFSNVLLWQAGVQLVMDTDPSVNNGATPVAGTTGIFTVTSTSNYTFNQTYGRRLVPPLLNSRDGVFNIAYIHSINGRPTLLGAATDRRLSSREETVELGGTPTTSWIRPTGLWPDDPAATVRMLRMGPSEARDEDLESLCGDGSLATLSACFMTNRVKSGLPVQVTLAHELGHVIGLHHRGSGGRQEKESYDKVNHQAGPLEGHGHPWDENVMTYGPNSERQDFDMIQAMVVRAHPLMRDDPPPSPAPPTPPEPPPPPPAAKPVPAAWTPSTDDVTLMQGYLTGVVPGLDHSSYDLGPFGPRGDGVDGIYGARTKAAVKAFQRDHGEGLTDDGIYGPRTRDAFDKELNG